MNIQEEGRLLVQVQYPGSSIFQTFKVVKLPFKIGRGYTNDLILSDVSVSQFHAEIFEEEDRFYLRDLQSTNGIFFNQANVERLEIESGKDVLCGNVRVKILPVEAPLEKTHKIVRKMKQEKRATLSALALSLLAVFTITLVQQWMEPKTFEFSKVLASGLIILIGTSALGLLASLLIKLMAGEYSALAMIQRALIITALIRCYSLVQPALTTGMSPIVYEIWTYVVAIVFLFWVLSFFFTHAFPKFSVAKIRNVSIGIIAGHLVMTWIQNYATREDRERNSRSRGVSYWHLGFRPKSGELASLYNEMNEATKEVLELRKEKIKKLQLNIE